MLNDKTNLDKISKGELILQKKIDDADEYFKKIDRNQFEEFIKQRKKLSKV